MTLWVDHFPTPVGVATVVVDGHEEVKRFHFGRLESVEFRRDQSATAAAREQIDAYFAGERRVFDLHLAPEGTKFQREVWQGLQAISFAQTMSYGELAAYIGRTGASRAVGAANGANPIALIIPCHRVIGGNRMLVGYAGGLSIKAALLAHEGVLPHEVAANAGPRTRIAAAPMLL